MTYDISPKTLANLVQSESQWNPNADNGSDRGLVQINRKAHPEVSDAEAFDPDFALAFAAKSIAQGKDYQWTACNCYSFVWVKLGDLPHMADIQPNSSLKVGRVAIFRYKGVKHVALVTKVGEGTFTVSEANYTHCKTGTRVIPISDPNLIGFWAN